MPESVAPLSRNVEDVLVSFARVEAGEIAVEGVLTDLAYFLDHGSTADYMKLGKFLQTIESFYAGHSVRVCCIALHIAQYVGYPDELMVAGAALFHDLGKVVWPEELHSKVGLTPEDWSIIHAHPQHGANILREHLHSAPKAMLRAVLEHHERPGGMGYPGRIPKLSRLGEIVAVADSYEAQTSQRAYRRHRYTHEQAVDDVGRWCHRDIAGAVQNYIDVL